MVVYQSDQTEDRLWRLYCPKMW